MADFGNGGFDAQAKENQKASSCVPAGTYSVVLVASDKKTTNDGTGSYLKMDFQIVSGEFQNRRVFENLNVWLEPRDDKKRMAIQIAKGQLSELCRAVGVLNPKDSKELHGIPLLIKLNCKENGEYGMKNNIVNYLPMPTQQLKSVNPETFEVQQVAASDNPWTA